ncbi:MAG: hypothetical protein QOH06_5516 [Acidobacteriota bacterium]|jgi:hypothetical protein|nr:hypothetical protein [Acidobacteriota bacterium]
MGKLLLHLVTAIALVLLGRSQGWPRWLTTAAVVAGFMGVHLAGGRVGEVIGAKRSNKRYQTMLARVLLTSFLALGMAFPLFSQVEVRQAKPEDLAAPGTAPDQEVPNPMLLDLSLGVQVDGKVQRKPMNETAFGQTRTFWETKRYVCDKARVARVQVTKRQGRRGAVELEIAPTLSTEWYRQDIDLTVALVSDGKEIERKTWDDLTIGSDQSAANKMGCLVCGASTSKTPKAVFKLKEEEFATMFGEGRAPIVRVIVNVQKGGEEEEEEEEE